tara:strand:+ start:13298 stop:14785 length:1488 start_codon:yes stop_codon:yes gene_type:complete
MPEIYSKIALKKFIKDTKLPIKNYSRMSVPLMIEGIDEFLDKNRGGKYLPMRVYMDRVKKEMAAKEETIVKNRVKRINVADRPTPKEIFDKKGGAGLGDVKNRKYLPVSKPTRAGGGGGEDEEGMRSRYKKPVKVLYTYPKQNPITNSSIGLRYSDEPPYRRVLVTDTIRMNYSGKELRPPMNRMNLNLRKDAQEAATNVLNLTIDNVIQTSNEKGAGALINEVLRNVEAKKIVRRKIKNKEMMMPRVNEIISDIMSEVNSSIQNIENENAATEFLATEIAKTRLGKMKPSGLALETREGFFDREPDRRPSKIDYLSAVYPPVNKSNKISRSGTYISQQGNSQGGAIDGVEFSYYGKDSYIKAQAERFKRIKSGVFPKGFTMPPRPSYDTINPFVPLESGGKFSTSRLQNSARRARETEAKYANERALKTPTKDEILKKYSLQFSRQNKVSYGVALSQFQDKYGMRGDSLPQSILKQYGYTGKSFKNAGARGSLF